MTKILTPTLPYGVIVQGKIGKPWQHGEEAFLGRMNFGAAQFGNEGTLDEWALFGDMEFGVAIFGNTTNAKAIQAAGIYQRRHCKEGLLTCKMKFYAPPPSRTEPQGLQRDKMGPPVAAWKLLTDEQKAVYYKRAIGLHMTGYNLFIKEAMLSA